MIKLRLQNFQAHKDTTVEIPVGKVTYLEGRSDIGKSAVVRAMRWLAENRPTGGSFVTFGSPRGTNSVVTMSYDGTEIERERGKGKNLYRLNGVEYAAFGTDTPQDVVDALKLSPYAFQLQGEPSFLISLNPTETAKILAETCGLGIIDMAVAHVRGKKTEVDADIRKTEILLEAAQKQFEEAKAQLPLADKYEEVAGYGDAVETLEVQVSRIEGVLCDEPEGEIIDIVPVSKKINQVGELLSRSDKLIAQCWRMSETLQNEPTGVIIDLAPVATKVKQINTEQETWQIYSDMYNKVLQVLQSEPVSAPIDTAPLYVAVEKNRALFLQYDNLEMKMQTIKETLSQEPLGVPEDLSDLIKQRDAIKVCPTCGREL